MPRPFRNEPDDQDVFNAIAAIGEDYACVVEITVAYKADYVESTARAFAVGGVVDKVVVHQAMHRRRYRPTISQAQVNFTLAYDLLMQFSGGGSTAARRGPTYQWSGGVEVPRRRRV